MKKSNEYLKIFVYGTLKQGLRNHNRFCDSAISIEPARTWGKLYHLSAGYPALEVPDYRILALGTSDPFTDTRKQNSVMLSENAMLRPEGDWDIVHGELMTFTNPGISLPPIDRLEEFNPDGLSMYKRVLVAVRSENKILPVWLYHYEFEHNGKRITSGNWWCYQR